MRPYKGVIIEYAHKGVIIEYALIRAHSIIERRIILKKSSIMVPLHNFSARTFPTVKISNYMYPSLIPDLATPLCPSQARAASTDCLADAS